MNRIFILLALMCIMALSCKKEKHATKEIEELPAPNPSSTFKLITEGVTYELKIKGQKLETTDTARFRINAALPDIRIVLDAKAVQHENGLGEYALVCCDNDVFETLPTKLQMHWEGEGSGIPGLRQMGFVKIIKKDSKGYEGTFSLLTAPTGKTSPLKEFTGNFTVIY